MGIENFGADYAQKSTSSDLHGSMYGLNALRVVERIPCAKSAKSAKRGGKIQKYNILKDLQYNLSAARFAQ
jgi:hypothetical protein